MTIQDEHVATQRSDAASDAASARRGLPALVVAAVAVIAAGTWALGSGPDAPPAERGSAAVVVPEVPTAAQEPPLSVAPAPSDEAYAAARRASRAHHRAAAPKRAAVAPVGTAP